MTREEFKLRQAVSRAVDNCRGEGWTVRGSFAKRSWRVSQGGDVRQLSIDGLLAFTGILRANKEVEETVDQAHARMALAELKRRHPEWDQDPPCPDCGSREHFECGQRPAHVQRVTITLAAVGDRADISPDDIPNILTDSYTISIGAVGDEGQQITGRSEKSRNSD